ncbi:hypothetical protein ACN6P9_28345, partial [Klebsiella pneumoniae]
GAMSSAASDVYKRQLCSWFGLPRQSQFAEAISQRIFGEQ